MSDILQLSKDLIATEKTLQSQYHQTISSLESLLKADIAYSDSFDSALGTLSIVTEIEQKIQAIKDKQSQDLKNAQLKAEDSRLKAESLVSKNITQQHRTLVIIVLLVITFLLYLNKKTIIPFLSKQNKFVVGIPVIILLVIAYLNRSFIIEPFVSDGICSTKTIKDLLSLLNKDDLLKLSQSVYSSSDNSSIDKLKNVSEIFTEYNGQLKIKC